MHEEAASQSIDLVNDADILKLVMSHTKVHNKNYRRIYSLFGNNALFVTRLMHEKIVDETAVINHGNISDYSTTTDSLQFAFKNFDDFIDEITADDLVILVPPYPNTSPTTNTENYSPQEQQKRLQHFIEALDKKNTSFILFYGTLDKTNHYPIHWRWGHTIKLRHEPSLDKRMTLHHLFLSRNFATLVMQKEHYGQTLQPLFHVMFEVHAANHPDSLAVFSDSQLLTYGELNKRANQFVQLMMMNELYKTLEKSKNSAADCVVAIALGRNNPQTLIAELATEKAGVTKLLVNTDTRRVPIKVSLESILNSGTAILITNPDFNAELKNVAKSIGYLPRFEMVSVLLIDENDFDCRNVITTYLKQDAEKYTVNPNYLISPQATIYLGETSGTTGTAKFARIPFGGLPFATSAHIQALQLQPGGRTLQLVAKKFDARFLEISMTLASLGTVVLSDYETYENYQKLAQVLLKQKITCLTVVPALLEQLLTVEKFPFVTNWLVVGDGVESRLLDNLWDKLSAFQQPFSILFGYGTTQTTIQGSYLLYRKGQPLTAGWPAFGLNLIYAAYADIKKHRALKKNVFISSKELFAHNIACVSPTEKPQEVLVLAQGPCRMKGYVKGEEIIDHADEQICYNTGDKAFLLTDGSITISERSLRRPKIYGQIVSLKTVEESIAKLESVVEEARMAAHTFEAHDGKKIKKLAAYIVPIDKSLIIDDPNNPSDESLYALRTIRKDLLNSHPTYAVPALVNMVFVKSLPRSENKKTPNDPEIRRRWPIPCLRFSHTSIFQEELHGLETSEKNFLEKAQTIAATTVGLMPNEIGFNDKLDELGFDSLLRMRFVSQLKSLDIEAIGIENTKFQKALNALSVGEFQKHCTLLSLYNFLSRQAEIGRSESAERIGILRRKSAQLYDKLLVVQYRIHKKRSLGTIEMPCYFIPSMSGIGRLDYGTSELLNLPFEITYLLPPSAEEIANAKNDKVLTEHYTKQIEPKHGVIFLVAWSSGGDEGVKLADIFRKKGVTVYLFLLDTTHPRLLQQCKNIEFINMLVRIGGIVRKNILALLSLPESTLFSLPTVQQFIIYPTKVEQVEFLFQKLNSEFEYLLAASTQFTTAVIADCRLTIKSGKHHLIAELTTDVNAVGSLTKHDTLILAEKSITPGNPTLGWTCQRDVTIFIAQNMDHFELLHDGATANEIKTIAIRHLQENAEPICRGIAYSMQNEHRTALRYLNEVASNNPNNFEYLYYRALSYFKLKRYHEAFNDLKNYFMNVPKNGRALFLLARIYYENDNHENALRIFYETTQASDDPIIFNVVAPYIFMSLKVMNWIFTDVALKQKLENLINNTPTLKAYQLFMPITEILQAHKTVTKEMKTILDEAIQLDSNDPTPYYLRGKVELKLGHYQAARNDFSKASELGGGNKGLNLYYQGLVLFEEEQYQQAIMIFTEVIKYNKDKVFEAHLYRGLAYNKLKYRSKAIEDLNMVIENCEKSDSVLHPSEHVIALNTRGFIYKEEKDFHQAFNDFTKAVTLDDNSVVAHHNAGLIARNMATNLISTARINETARLNTIARYFQTACIHIQKVAETLPEGSASQQNMLRELEATKENFEKFRQLFKTFFDKGQTGLSSLTKSANKPSSKVNTGNPPTSLFFNQAAPKHKITQQQGNIHLAEESINNAKDKPKASNLNMQS